MHCISLASLLFPLSLYVIKVNSPYLKLHGFSFTFFFLPPLGVGGEGRSSCMVFSCQLDSNYNRVIWCLSSLPSLQAKSSKNPQDTILRIAAFQDKCFDFEHEIHLQKLYWKTLQQYFICDRLQGAQKVLETRSKQYSAFTFLTLGIKFQLGWTDYCTVFSYTS